jgi:hypothetical protein
MSNLKNQYVYLNPGERLFVVTGFNTRHDGSDHSHVFEVQMPAEYNHGWLGMTDDRHRQPAVDEAPHAIPEYAAVLAAPRQRTMPEPSNLESKDPQRVLLQGHSVVLESVVKTRSEFDFSPYLTPFPHSFGS